MNEAFAKTKKILAAKLKEKFPNVKFSLTKRNYDTLVLQYDKNFVPKVEDQEMITAMANSVKGRFFDGMQDIETKSKDYSGVGYVFINPYGEYIQKN